MSLSRRSFLTAAALPAWAREDKPPAESGDFRQPNLIEVVRLDRTIGVDLRFAGRKNLLGRPLYNKTRAYLQFPAAEALVFAHRKLKPQGYGILILDAYRPWAVTRELWEGVPKDKRKLLANPRKGSLHNRGCSVDLSLYDMTTGKEVKLPGSSDAATDHALPEFTGGNGQDRTIRDLMARILTAEGYTPDPNAWWHFDHKDWRRYRVSNIELSELR